MLTEIERRFPKITEEGLDDLRQRIGVKIGVTVEPWCYEATRDNIRHYAHGIGDDNPLWCDPEYAAKTRYGGHDRAAELSVRHQPHRVRLCRRAARRPRHVVGRRLDLAQDRQAQRRDLDRGLAEGPRRASDRASPAARSSRPITSTSTISTATWSPRPIAGAFAPSATTRASRAPSTRRSRRAQPRRYTDQELADAYKLYARRGNPRCETALLAGRRRRRGAAGDAQGPDDGHRLHRLCPGLGWPLHPRQQARLEADRRASRPRHYEPLRHSRTVRSACTGKRNSPTKSARPGPTITVRSAARGSPIT